MISRRAVLLAPLAAVKRQPFFVSALVDFVDDAMAAVFTPRRVDDMMRLFRQMGVHRVYWIDYGVEADEGFWSPYGGKHDGNLVGTIQALKDPMRVAVKAA